MNHKFSSAGISKQMETSVDGYTFLVLFQGYQVTCAIPCL